MKKCYTCQKLKKITEFNKNRSRKDGLNSICRECSKNRSRQYYKENREYHLKVIKSYSKKRNKKHRQIIDDIRSKGCVLCKEKEICCIHFHHLYDKEFEVGDSRKIGLGIDKIIKEINKCVRLCANCHAKVHANILSVDETHLCKEHVE